jgi:hypothetical protein
VLEVDVLLGLVGDVRAEVLADLRAGQGEGGW